jgi:hypothetical protein
MFPASDTLEVENLNQIGNSTSVVEKVWKPTDKQQQVISLPDSIFECLGGGAAGGGKTDLGILLPCVRQFTEHPKFKALVMRRTHTDLEKEIVVRQHEWYGGMGAVYNETKKRWKFPTGAIVQNGHSEREQDVRKYDTTEYNYIDWDESTHFSAFQYLYLSLSRCRSSSPDLPAFVRCFTNPGNIGHSFFKKRFVDPAPFGNKILIDKVTKIKRIYIPFLGRDNPHLLINDPLYLQRLEGLPEVEKRAKLYGDWSSYEGQVFSEFRVFRLSDEPENACHVMQMGPGGYQLSKFIPSWWPKILVIDWGWDAQTFAIWGAVSPNGRLFIYRTWSWRKTPIRIWAKELINLMSVGSENEEMLDDFVLCHSAGQHFGEEKTIREQVTEAFDDKYPIRLADRDRIGGKNLIHEYLRWRVVPRAQLPDRCFDSELANRILRNFGEEKYFEYLELFKEIPDEDNLPKLQILSHGPEGRENKELIDVIPACMPDEKNPEDVAEFDGDDPYDALRMAVKSAHLYVDKSKEELERRTKLQSLYDKLERKTAESQTAFYRNLEGMGIDGINNEEVYSVRAHRRLGNKRFH